MKIADLARWGNPAKLAAMRAIKAALEPLGEPRRGVDLKQHGARAV